MARKKKFDAQEQLTQAMAFWGSLHGVKQEDDFGLMDVFMRGLSAGMSIGREQTRAEQRKRENDG